jgi:hypothetical protein
MHKIRTVSSALFIILFFSVVCFADRSKSESLEINEIKGNYELTVPVSRLVMTIPKNNLSQGENKRGGSTDNPRYFYFEDKSLHLIISGWFEPAHGFPGIKKFWEDETRTWKQRGQPNPTDVLFEKIGSWDAIAYDISLPVGNNSHIRAHWLQAGTWIDIHLSITTDRPSMENRAKLHAFLKNVQVNEKKL